MLQVTPQIFSSTWPGLHVELKHFNPPKERRRHRCRDAKEMDRMDQSYDQMTPRPFERLDSGDSIKAATSVSLRTWLSCFYLSISFTSHLAFHLSRVLACDGACSKAWLDLIYCCCYSAKTVLINVLHACEKEVEKVRGSTGGGATNRGGDVCKKHA